MKRVLPILLALALILSTFAWATEGAGFTDGGEGSPASAAFSNGALSWTIHPGEWTGEGLVLASTYNADGRMLDVKTTRIADLSVPHSETVTLRAEDGGTYRFFLLDPSTCSPLMKALRGGTGIAAEPEPTPTPDEEEPKLEVVVGDAVFTATLADTQAAQEFAEMLPVTIVLDNYGGFEKVGSLGKTLTTADHQITTEPGDIILYSGNQIVLFYGSNSWSYTRLAKIDDLTGWTDALGNHISRVSVTFRLSTQSGEGKQALPLTAR